MIGRMPRRRTRALRTTLRLACRRRATATIVPTRQSRHVGVTLIDLIDHQADVIVYQVQQQIR